MRKNNDKRNGSALVEFAMITAMLLLPLLIGVWDASRLIDMNQVLTRAAREGVVLASRGDDPVTHVVDYVRSAGLAPERLTVAVQHGQDVPSFGQEVAVSLSYSISENIVFPWDILMNDGLTVVAYAKME